jgi:hypothetical protein
VEPFVHFTICLKEAVLNQLSREATLHLLCKYRQAYEHEGGCWHLTENSSARLATLPIPKRSDDSISHSALLGIRALFVSAILNNTFRN